MSTKDESKEPTINLGETTKAYPKEIFDNSGQVPPIGAERYTFVADFAKVMTDEKRQLCTLVFYQTYPLGEQTSRGFQISQVTHRPFLIVKIPLEEMVALGEYMHLSIPKIREHLRAGKPENSYGPTQIIREKDGKQ